MQLVMQLARMHAAPVSIGLPLMELHAVHLYNRPHA